MRNSSFSGYMLCKINSCNMSNVFFGGKDISVQNSM